MGRSTVLTGLLKRLDNNIEVIDDVGDYWTAKSHKAERTWFIQELQELAAEKSVRVTILGLVLFLL